MKVLQINIYYKEGSTGKIVDDIHRRLLRDGHDSYVAFGKGENWQLKAPDYLYRTTSKRLNRFYGRLGRLMGLRFEVAWWETYKLLKHIDRIKPDIVHLHCMNDSYVNPYMLLSHLGKRNYPVLVTHHADITISANCDYSFECNKWKTGCGHCETVFTERRSYFFDNTNLSWKKMRRAFSKIRKLYASGVSDWMTGRVRQSPFFKDKECITIKNGLDTDVFTYHPNTQTLREKLEIDANRRIILHATPSFTSPIKGGKYVVELARRMPEVAFVIVGIAKKDSSDLPSNIISIEHTNSKSEMAELYSLADLTLLTSFRESFSMVTAESLCCGTPVVGFKAGAPETIAIPEYSEFVDFGDVGLLKAAVERMMSRSIDKKAVSKQGTETYSAETMYASYLEYYKRILSAEH